MKRLILVILVALLFGAIMPTLAQDTVPTSVPTQAAVEGDIPPVVVPETPAETDADTLAFWQIAIHLINAGVALAIVYFLYRSVPAETRNELNTRIETELKEAEDKAKTTDTFTDDLLVEAAKRGFKLVKIEDETKVA